MGSVYGIGVRKTRGLYYANMRFNNKNYTLRAIDQNDAKRKYDMLALYLYGEHACTNNKDKKYTENELLDNYNLFISNMNKKRSSNFYGVCGKTGTSLFTAQISKHKKNYYIGAYKTEEEAAQNYDLALFYLFGKDSKKYNFPEKVESYSPTEVREWFVKKFESNVDGIFFEKKVSKYYGVVTINNKKTSIGYNEDKSITSLIRDAVILHYNTNDKLNNPDKIEEIQKITNEYLSEIIKKQNKYIGVSFIENKKLYTSRIVVNKKNIYIGSAKTPEEAAILYDNKSVELYGKKAKTNFPIENYIK